MTHLIRSAILLTAVVSLEAQQLPTYLYHLPQAALAQLPPALRKQLQPTGISRTATTPNPPPVGQSLVQGERVIFSFDSGAPQGAAPEGELLTDGEGTFYGTALAGGTYGRGAVFQLSSNLQSESLLYSFRGGVDGGGPIGNLVRDVFGNIYGLTSYGGDLSGPCAYQGCGILFKLDQLGRKTTLYVFPGQIEGGSPNPALTIDPAGNLYGTTSSKVFKVDTSGHGTTLYTFSGGSDGGGPLAGVTLDSAGNIFGTTSGGGINGQGVIFKLDKAGDETVLYSFSGGPDGGYPDSTLITDPEGNFYGTTALGGSYGPECFGCGVIFKLDSAGNQSVIFAFSGGKYGSGSAGRLVRDPAGNLFGTSSSGGISRPLFFQTCGLVFKVDTSGNESIIHEFTGGSNYFGPPLDGCMPTSGLVLDLHGNLVGTTPVGGGPSNFGTVYSLSGGSYKETVYSFAGGNSTGSDPVSIVKGPSGDLYGATSSGGAWGQGAVFKLDTFGQESLIFSFTGGKDGGQPQSVFVDSTGNLYGVASSGGTLDSCGGFFGFSLNCGVVFKIDPFGNETVLHSFTGLVGASPDGASPGGSLVRDSLGNLYGATQQGGNFTPDCFVGCGVVFKVDPSGTETVLHSFQGGLDGSGPSSVILDQAGNLYGTVNNNGLYGCGYVFEMNPSGNLTVLHYFPCQTSDGATPYGGVVRDPQGNLYGTTSEGGTAGVGAIFKVDQFGNETVLYSFTDGTDGAFPALSLVRDAAGNLYGQATQEVSCYYGGGCGDVFKLSPSGNLSVLFAFQGGNTGTSPVGSLILDFLGNVYGAASGGIYSGGILYQIIQ